MDKPLQIAVDGMAGTTEATQHAGRTDMAPSIAFCHSCASQVRAVPPYAAARLPPKWRMASRRRSNIKVAGIATIILIEAVLAVLLSVAW